MQKSIGILAHVDAGKTTLSEQILYHAGALRTRGRVDHQDAFLDSDALERERGITIFSGQAQFSYQGSDYTLVDTPGHGDFSAEMERTLAVLDLAVLVLDVNEAIPGHAETVWRLLEEAGVPVVVFLNKTDRPGADPQARLQEAKERLSPDCVDCLAGLEPLPEGLIEEAAGRDDALLEAYLEGTAPESQVWESLRRLVKERRLFPCFGGSALLDQGVEGLLRDLDRLLVTDYQSQEDKPFAGLVYQIRHDSRGARVALLRVLEGSLSARDEVAMPDGTCAKANELRRCHGGKYLPIPSARAGEFCAVTGWDGVQPGEGVGACRRRIAYHTVPMLTTRVILPEGVPARTALEGLRQLQEEDPSLQFRWEEESQELSLRFLGPIQLEVLRQLAARRLGLDLSFGESRILYRETVTGTAVGYGHFEPLRHYAEVHLRLSPGEPGSGVTFQSGCPTDRLDRHYQNLIGTHVLEKEHRGILTGSPVTDLAVTLVTGRAHLKHTEGGDFRQAVYRAIRQGLEQLGQAGQLQLLEPWEDFRLTVPQEQLGRVMADLQRMSADAQPPEMLPGGRCAIQGRAPLATLMNYGQELAAFTRGSGTLSAQFAGYFACHNAPEVIAQIGYDKDRDTENPSGSIFCAHGAGFYVPWDQVKDHIHCTD